MVAQIEATLAVFNKYLHKLFIKDLELSVCDWEHEAGPRKCICFLSLFIPRSRSHLLLHFLSVHVFVFKLTCVMFDWLEKKELTDRAQTCLSFYE